MATASEATWIWYPGDYEIWLGNRMSGRRMERGAFFPPFWKMDSHYVTVEFSRLFDLPEEEEVCLAAEGRFNVRIDGKFLFGMPQHFTLPAGRHCLNIKIWNQATPPALYIKGRHVQTDASWKVTWEDKEWIDESGRASDKCATTYVDAGCWNFNDPAMPPSAFALAREPRIPLSAASHEGGMLYDFGKETFGYVVLKGLAGQGEIDIYYGESPEEALDIDGCETLDKITVDGKCVTDLSMNHTVPLTDDYVLENSKAFRYIYIKVEAGVTLADVAMQYEYLPEEYRGAFRCNDGELNRIWEVAAYTMHLTTREFFIDGIKRDRWVWSGDAIQSYLMNYYLFFDAETVKRTIWLLRGKDPVTSHTNTILDYSFFWLISIYDYYLFTGDVHFVEQIYPRMKSLMEYVQGRTNAAGMVEGQLGDWVFVDWADFPMSKQGALAFEQILFCKSLEAMEQCAALTGHEEDQARYRKAAEKLHADFLPTFWNEEKQAIVHNVEQGRQSSQVNKFPNMFAITLGLLDEDKCAGVMKNVMLNERVPKITTPYMRFYELEAMCVMGHQPEVLQEMKAYWGGMLREGATSFWEKYNPEESGVQHLAMYGRPYGKSLCHAWGASPIYLLGRYYLGVKPLTAGYEEFEVRPALGGLKWMEGRVPTPHGDISVYMDENEIRVKTAYGKGYVYFTSQSGQPEASAGRVESLGEGRYRVWMETGEMKINNLKP